MPLRVWQAKNTNHLDSQEECERLRELSFRVVLNAAERTRSSDGKLILSLAGGRKTMSADLQRAGQVFGAHAWLHVVGQDQLPERLRSAEPTVFTAPLTESEAASVTPIWVGSARRSELLDVHIEGHRVTSRRFPLTDAGPASFSSENPSVSGFHLCEFEAPTEAPLWKEVEHRERSSIELMGNFLSDLDRDDHRGNWRSLYRLSPRQIESLRRTRLSVEHTALLRRLPKADLHRHIGGCLRLESQVVVARAVWSAMKPAERHKALTRVSTLLKLADAGVSWPWNWPALLSDDAEHPYSRSHRCAALLLNAPLEALKLNLYTVTEPRVALKHTHPNGFAAYERPGELTGSAILQHPAALDPYAQAIVAEARDEGLTYLELRGSPHKYDRRQPGRFLERLRHALYAAGANDCPDTSSARQQGAVISPTIGFIWILDRRQPERIGSIVEHAVAARRSMPDFLLGLDMAGDEGTHTPERFAEAFTPAFKECLRVTIHAGEGEAAENIWQAAYHLHADRIGHGLTLAEHPALRERFRDRDICLELCPTSNVEVVGFRDPSIPESAMYPHYPIDTFLSTGVPFTLCTDNPGISRTTLAEEYLTASRMSEQFSLWQALSVMRDAYVHAFSGAATRERLIRSADATVYRILSSSDLDQAFS